MLEEEPVMNDRNRLLTISLLCAVILLLTTACSGVSQPDISYNPEKLVFSGEKAFKVEGEFVNQFPNRHSGQENNTKAAAWLHDQFTGMGLSCRYDDWEVINYSELTPLRNVICELPGESDQEILVIAHHDQSPDTIYGADNDGSGIAIMLQLAEIFASEQKLPYKMVFLSSDGEEYGMLGSRRYVQTHPDHSQIIAGISLDNLGKYFYDGLDMFGRGQFRRYGVLWLQILAQESAKAAGDLWIPQINSSLDQVLYQTVPISFMDQGPLVAVGIPAVGFAGHVPPEYSEEHWNTYHTPLDTMEIQSPDTLHQVGRITEATLRQLLSMDTFPQESGPYVYLEGSRQVFKGVPLWAIFIGFVALFFIGSIRAGQQAALKRHSGWRNTAVHFLGLWLPLLASIILLYIFVEVGLMDKWELYPSQAKGEPLFNPKWPAVILWIIGLTVFLWLGRKLASRFSGEIDASVPRIKNLALLIIGLSAVYILLANPFSLLLMVPVLFWFLIAGRRGVGKSFDVLFFLLGGLIVYVLFYFFGFVILRNGLNVLWYVMMMFSCGMVSFKSAIAITAIIAAGLSMVVNPAQQTRTV